MSKQGWEDNIKIFLKVIGVLDVQWTYLAQNRTQNSFEDKCEPLGSTKSGEFLD
jgi:hypothetical protein